MEGLNDQVPGHVGWERSHCGEDGSFRHDAGLLFEEGGLGIGFLQGAVKNSSIAETDDAVDGYLKLLVGPWTLKVKFR